jgi:predicted regulator of Ras-like GTPase activity (Roadblock/LC7/MglB family)
MKEKQPPELEAEYASDMFSKWSSERDGAVKRAAIARDSRARSRKRVSRSKMSVDESDKRLPRQRRPEVKRDIETTEFTNILRRFWATIPTVVVAAFVDQEGECVDYVSSVEPYEARVNAAQVVSILGTTLSLRDKLGFGETHTLEVIGSEKELWARRIDNEYTMIVVANPGIETTLMKRALVRTVHEFRDEVNIARPAWEPAGDSTLVETRSATAWQYAPVSFTTDGVRVVISDVIGRWEESDEIGSHKKVCFRIRTKFGEEHTLVHDPKNDEWILRY